MKKLLIAAALTLAATAAFARNDAMSLIPNDAVTVGVVHINQIRTSPLVASLFENTDNVSSNGEAERFLTEAGLDPKKDVDLVIVATSPKTNLAREADVVVLAEGRFNVDRLTKALITRGAVKKNSYFMLPDSQDNKGAVAFPDSHLAIIGNESAVIEALATRASGGSSFNVSLLGGNLSRIDADATAWALVDVNRASRLVGAPHLPSGGDVSKQALAAAVRNISTVGIWATDTGDALKLGAFGLASDADTLELLEDTLRGALSAARLAVKDSQPDLVSVLRRFNVERTKDAVRISGTIPADSIRKVMVQHKAEK